MQRLPAVAPLALIAVLCLCVGDLPAQATQDAGQDWPAFRGPAGDGISAGEHAPTSWDEETNVKWKVALPRPANGSPIVSNGRVFLTCAEDEEGKRRSLYCFDRVDGKKLWVRPRFCTSSNERVYIT